MRPASTNACDGSAPTVKDYVQEKDAYVVNPTETLAAREKLGLLKDRFAVWAFEDMARREHAWRSCRRRARKTTC